MTERSATHFTFVIERTFDAPPARVFHAFADPEAKTRWFAGPADWDSSELEFDFSVGGREVNRGGPKEGPVSTFIGHYYDIVPNERIVFSYEMYLDDTRISVSLTTIEFRAEGSATRLVLTEQDAFLDGYDIPAQREQGTRELLEALAAEVEHATANA